MKYLLLILLLMYPASALAQAPTQMWLARFCVSEAGFQIDKPFEDYSDDCAAMAEVLRSRSSVGRVTIGIMRAYSRHLFDRDRTDRRAYIPFLHLKRRTPRNWREHLSWSRYRERFIQIYELAGRILRGEETAMCEPHHWGAPWDSVRRRSLRLGWRRIDCGNTFNDFWRID